MCMYIYTYVCRYIHIHIYRRVCVYIDIVILTPQMTRSCHEDPTGPVFCSKLDMVALSLQCLKIVVPLTSCELQGLLEESQVLGSDFTEMLGDGDACQHPKLHALKAFPSTPWELTGAIGPQVQDTKHAAATSPPACSQLNFKLYAVAESTQIRPGASTTSTLSTMTGANVLSAAACGDD